jgi:hypothetical protein
MRIIYWLYYDCARAGVLLGGDTFFEVFTSSPLIATSGLPSKEPDARREELEALISLFCVRHLHTQIIS